MLAGGQVQLDHCRRQAERRPPTLAEINAVSADTPVFVMHLYLWGG